jgi:beta-galactosidase beta subunit
MGWIGQTQSSAQRIATLHRKYVQYQVSVVSNECVWV